MTSIVYQGLTQILAQILTIPTMPIFWIMVLLLAIQIGITYKKKQAQIVTKLSAFLFAIMECWIVTVLSGILGGIIASGLLLLTGVAIPYEVLPYLWVLMICLFFIEQRFICFAYAGGILVLIQWVAEGCGMSLFAFDSRGLLLFIAILHFTEAILVRLGGSLQAMPVYSRNEKGILTVKTQFERIWPVPLVFPVPAGPISMTALYSGYLVMPERWPLIHTIGNIETAVIYQLVPVLAMIGYRDMAEPGRERVQVYKSAGLLLCYSGILCFFVWVSSSRQPMLVVAALFAILGHEGILWIGRISMRKYVHSKKE